MTAAESAPEMSTCVQSSSQHLSYVLNGPPVGLALRNLSSPCPEVAEMLSSDPTALEELGEQRHFAGNRCDLESQHQGKELALQGLPDSPGKATLPPRHSTCQASCSVSSTLCVSMFCLHSHTVLYSWALALFTDSFYKTLPMRQGREWPWLCPQVYFQLFRPTFNMRLISSNPFHFQSSDAPHKGKQNEWLIDFQKWLFINLFWIVLYHWCSSR